MFPLSISCPFSEKKLCQFIVEQREEFETEEEFWAVYKDKKGNKMCYTHILDRLKSERAVRNSLDAANAHRFFKAGLDSSEAGDTFFYLKSAKKTLMVQA